MTNIGLPSLQNFLFDDKAPDQSVRRIEILLSILLSVSDGQDTPGRFNPFSQIHSIAEHLFIYGSIWGR